MTNDQMAFQAMFKAIKHKSSTGMFQFILEVNEADADECLRRIGGLPKSGETRWVAVAVIEDEK